MKRPTLKGSVLSLVLTAAGAGVAWTATRALDGIGSISERLDALELSQDNWKALTDHENRLRTVEIATRVNDQLLERLWDRHAMETAVHVAAPAAPAAAPVPEPEPEPEWLLEPIPGAPDPSPENPFPRHSRRIPNRAPLPAQVTPENYRQQQQGPPKKKR